jgi:outer membrane protein
MVTAPVTGLVDAVPANTKIATMDLEKTLYETPAGKRASAAFDKTRKTKQSELDKKQKDLQKAAAELDKQAPILKPDVLAQKKGALEKQFVELQQTYMKLERDLAGERTKLIQDLLKKAQPIIEEIAKAEGIHLIVDQSAVLFADPGVDLTAKLNARMK